jgi:hypothetical protein
MSDKLPAITVENTTDIINQLEKDFYDIPFGNTAFQTKAFVLAASITPERMYRTVGLQLISVLNNVRESIYKKQMFEIEREEKLEQLNSGTLDKWEQKKLELTIKRGDDSQQFSDKILNDTLNELNLLYSEYVKLPKFTREQFEAAESNYFEQSLERQSRGIDGAIGSLIHMREDIPAIDKYLTDIKKVEKLDSATLENLRLSMENQLDKVREKEQDRMMAARKALEIEQQKGTM